MSEGDMLDAQSEELQRNIDWLAAQLGVQSIPVGQRTNDGLNIYFGEDDAYHYDFWERGQLGVNRAGSLDDVLYWFAQGKAFSAAPHGDRRQMFQHEFDILSRINPEWGKRCVRENAAMLRNGQPEDVALLPDFGEPL